MNPRTYRRPAPGAATVAFCLGLALLLGAVSPSLGQGWKSPPRRSPASGRGTPVAPIDPFRPEKGGVYSNLGLLERLTRDAVGELADSLSLPPGSEVTILSTTWHEANWFVGNLLAESLTSRGYRVTTGDWGQPGDTTSQATPRDGNRAMQERQPDAPSGEDPQEGSKQEQGDSGQEQDKGEEAAAPEDTTRVSPDSVKAAVDPLWGEKPSEPTEASGAGTSVPLPRSPSPSSAGRGQLPAGNVLDLRVLEFGVAYPQVGRKLLLGPVRFTRVGGVFAQVHSLEGPGGNFRQMVSAERHRVDRLSGSQRALVEGASYPFSPPGLNPPSLSRYIEPTVVVAIVGSLVYLFYANQK